MIRWQEPAGTLARGGQTFAAGIVCLWVAVGLLFQRLFSQLALFQLGLLTDYGSPGGPYYEHQSDIQNAESYCDAPN